MKHLASLLYSCEITYEENYYSNFVNIDLIIGFNFKSATGVYVLPVYVGDNIETVMDYMEQNKVSNYFFKHVFEID